MNIEKKLEEFDEEFDRVRKWEVSEYGGNISQDAQTVMRRYFKQVLTEQEIPLYQLRDGEVSEVDMSQIALIDTFKADLIEEVEKLAWETALFDEDKYINKDTVINLIKKQ